MTGNHPDVQLIESALPSADELAARHYRFKMLLCEAKALLRDRQRPNAFACRRGNSEGRLNERPIFRPREILGRLRVFAMLVT